MPIIVVRAVKPRTQPRRLGVGDERDCARSRRLKLLGPSAYGADLEARVLWTEQDLVAVETEEDVRCIFAG